MELAASEAERAALVSAARTADLASRAVRAQLAEAGVAFRAAMATAQGFLQQGGCSHQLCRLRNPRFKPQLAQAWAPSGPLWPQRRALQQGARPFCYVKEIFTTPLRPQPQSGCVMDMIG